MEPQAILFDEPTSALDPRMTAEVLAVMTDLAGDGLTMVVVTHAMQFARRVAHTVHVFGDGRIIESGPPGQIFDEPAPGSDPQPACGGGGGVRKQGPTDLHGCAAVPPPCHLIPRAATTAGLVQNSPF